MPTAKRRAAEERRQRPPAKYETLTLHCPRCRKTQALAMPVDGQGKVDWTVKPLMDCPGCGFTAPSPNFERPPWIAGPADESWHPRYHAAQANPASDTMEKRSARKGGEPTVRCVCGAVFPSTVEGQ